MRCRRGFRWVAASRSAVVELELGGTAGWAMQKSGNNADYNATRGFAQRAALAVGAPGSDGAFRTRLGLL